METFALVITYFLANGEPPITETIDWDLSKIECFELMAQYDGRVAIEDANGTVYVHDSIASEAHCSKEFG